MERRTEGRPTRRRTSSRSSRFRPVRSNGVRPVPSSLSRRFLRPAEPMLRSESQTAKTFCPGDLEQGSEQGRSAGCRVRSPAEPDDDSPSNPAASATIPLRQRQAGCGGTAQESGRRRLRRIRGMDSSLIGTSGADLRRTDGQARSGSCLVDERQRGGVAKWGRRCYTTSLGSRRQMNTTWIGMRWPSTFS